MKTALIKSREDWTALRDKRYSRRKLLALCTEAKRWALGRLLLCAAVYSEEIQSLTGRRGVPTTRPEELLQKLNTAAATQKALSTALTGVRSGGDCSALAIYFSGLRPPEEEDEIEVSEY